MRAACCAPFCRRTTDAAKLAAKGHTEWLCQVHWSFVPPSLKRRRAKLRRMAKHTMDGGRLGRIDAADAVLWERCKALAIERAGGV